MNNPQLEQNLNYVAAYLSYGYNWHRTAANELRQLPKLRGYARWHDNGEASEDSMSRIRLDKMLRDQLGFKPDTEGSRDWIAKATAVSIEDVAGFKAHFIEWIEREGKFLTVITSAIDLMRSEDIELYNELCKLSAFTKNERIRAKWVYDGLEFVKWEPHHIAVESKWLHDYFTDIWKPGEPIDFNIG